MYSDPSLMRSVLIGASIRWQWKVLVSSFAALKWMAMDSATILSMVILWLSSITFFLSSPSTIYLALWNAETASAI